MLRAWQVKRCSSVSRDSLQKKQGSTLRVSTARLPPCFFLRFALLPHVLLSLGPADWVDSLASSRQTGQTAAHSLACLLATNWTRASRFSNSLLRGQKVAHATARASGESSAIGKSQTFRLAGGGYRALAGGWAEPRLMGSLGASPRRPRRPAA